jgi:FG-GAP-like repeat/Bacterial Ig-like domain/Domain of unknown function (DUF4214)
MKFHPLSALFGGRNSRRSRPSEKRRTHRLSRLGVESLEQRELLSITPPRIVNVTPPDGSVTTTATPVIAITFNEAMNASQVQNVANYSMFDATGNALQITGASYNPSNFTVTLSYAGNFPGGELIREKYSVFVRGDQIHDAAPDNLPLAQPGQLIVGDSGTGNVSLVNMPGNGTFGAISNYSATIAIKPSAAIIADLNGNGTKDLVVADSNHNDIEIYAGLASGGFSTNPTTIGLPAGSTTPTALVAAKLQSSSETSLDIAVADKGSNDVVVFLSDGQGGYQAGVPYGVGAAPVSITAGNLDGSGNIDLAVADSGDANVSVLVNKGAGTFKAAVSVATGKTGMTGIASANLSANGSHLPDLVVSSSTGVAVLANTNTSPGTISFATAQSISSVNTTAVALGNVAGNNLNDIVATTATGGGQVLVFQNLGTNPYTFSLSTFAAGTNPVAVQIGDVSGNGKNDVIVANSVSATQGDIAVLTNQSNGGSVNLNAPVAYTVAPGPVALAIDLNNSGVVDLAATPSTTEAVTSVVRAQGGKFVASTDLQLATSSINAVVAGDLNGDGVPDFIVANSLTHAVSVFLSQPGGGYGSPVSFSVGTDPVALALAPFFNDTYPNDGARALDLAVLDQAGHTVYLFKNNGFGGFSAPPTTLNVGANPTALLRGGFNNDVFPDLVVANSNGNLSAVTLYLGNGNGTFQKGQALLSGGDPMALAAADFDGTGHLDIAVVDRTRGQVTILHGSGTGAFTTGPGDSYQVGGKPTTIAVGDLNRDGLPDIIVNGSFSSQATISVLLNVGGGNFSAPIKTTVISNPVEPNPQIGSIAVVNAHDSFYPDVVISLSDPSGDGAANNLVFLTGVGDGTFQAPVYYSTEGGGQDVPPSYLAVGSDPFIRVTTFTAEDKNIFTNLVANGTFNVPDLSGDNTNLSAWSTDREFGSAGQWKYQTGPLSPLSGTAVPPPPTGSAAAMMDESYLSSPSQPLLGFGDQPTPNIWDYNSAQVIYQDISIPATASQATLTFSLYAQSFASISSLNGAAFSDPTQTPALDYFPNQTNATRTPNQQVRVDIVSPEANVFTVTPGPTGVLMNLFQTTPTTPGVFGYTTEVFNLGTQFSGQTIRLRFAEVNNQGLLVVGVAKVRLEVSYAGVVPITITGVQLRNPGFGQTANFGGASTDNTLIGHVSDNGSANNIASIKIDTTNTGNFNGPGVINVTNIDALGNFSVTLPTTVLPGRYTVQIQAVDFAGNVDVVSFSYTFQGPSVNIWQAAGPGPITFESNGVNYTTVSGDITAIAVDPRDPTGNVFYVGTDNGGIWKTLDGGNDWTPLTDYATNSQGQPISVSVGALVIDPNNLDVVYAGTGVANTASTAHPGIGILKSINAGKSWTLIATSVFTGARISTISISDAPPGSGLAEHIYVAVASGGQFGPGIYESSDGGNSWSDITTLTSMFLDAGGTLKAAGIKALASATDIEVDRLSKGELVLWAGFANLTGVNGTALVPNSVTAGVWKSTDGGATWLQIVGGHDTKGTAVLHQTIPHGAAVTMVKIGLPGETEVYGSDGLMHPSGRAADDGIAYVFLDNTAAVLQEIGGTGSLDNTTGLFKTEANSAGLSWTHVMLRQNVPFELDPPNHGKYPLHLYEDALLFGGNNELNADPDNAAVLQVDPTNANVVYLGASTRYPGSTINFADIEDLEKGHGLIRVDTSDMRDTNYLSPYIVGIVYPNDGDDIIKKVDATLEGWILAKFPPTGPLESDAEYPNKDKYTGEGVFWYDLNQGNDAGAIPGFTFSENWQFPNVYYSLAFDPQGRLLVGTLGGIWRGVSQGFQPDLTSGAATATGFGVWSIEADLGRGKTIEGGMKFTNINGNLQIADETSVAIDSNNPNSLDVSMANLGWAQTQGTLTWATTDQFSYEGSANQVGQTPPDQFDPFSGDAAYAGAIAAGPYDPSNPSSIYRTWAGVAIAFDQVQRSDSGGGQHTFDSITNGLSIISNLAPFPALAVDPNQVIINGQPQTELAFATQSIFESTFGGSTWIQISQPLVSGGDYISALAIAPSNNNAFYVGTASGKVFVDFHNGGDGFPNRNTGLPGTAVLDIAVDPVDAQEAFATFGGFGTGKGHVFMTTNGGTSWRSITANLPDVPAYSAAYDPRATAAFPEGRLYVGTQVGVYVSYNLGATWSKLGQGLPNVPVVDITFDQNFEKLAVATQGRGTWVINTDIRGAVAEAVTPSTPVAYTPATTPVAPGLTSIIISFNKAVDPRTFTLASIDKFTGPNGPINVTSVVNLDPGSFTQYQIKFAPQTTDGVYTLTIGPNIKDFVGLSMDQNGNGINGEIPGDEFTAVFDVNSTDDGRFISGLFHDLLGRAADSPGFVSQIAPLDAARAGELGPTALIFLQSTEALSNLVYDASTGTGYYEQFLHRAASSGEVAGWVQAMQAGLTPEQVIVAIVSSAEYFTAEAGSTDVAFVNQLYHDLLGRPADTGGLNNFLSVLTNAESAARFGIVNGLDQSAEYRTNLVQSYYTKLLKRSASPADVSGWLGAFSSGTTDEQFIAALIGSAEYLSLNGGTNSSWLSAAFQAILSRMPTSEEQSLYLGQLQGNVSRATVAGELLASTEYRQNLVTADFQQILGRNPDPGGLATFVNDLQKGDTDEFVVSSLVSSGEYYQDHVGTATTQAPQDANWLAGAYMTVLNRAEDSAGGTTFLKQLSAAEGQARAQVATAIVGSTEYRINFITTIFQGFLGRAPSTSEIASGLGILAQPPAGAGKPSPDALFEEGILSSNEYFFDQRAPVTDLATDQQWLTSLYENVLKRSPDAAGLNFNLNAMLNGTAAQRLAIATAMDTSTEYRKGVIVSLFKTYLRRSPTQAEISTDLVAFASGATIESLISGLVGSNEYFQNPTLGNNNNTVWLNQAYLDILGRNRDVAGSQMFLNDLNNGTMTRTQVATALLTSTEYRIDLVSHYYQNYLGRTQPPTAAEVAPWVAALNSGVRDEQVLAAILASGEYFLKTHIFP